MTTGEAATVARLLRARARDHELWVSVSGASMGTRYRDGSRALVTPLDRAPRTGEVWVFCDAEGRIIAHRYLRRRDGRLIFRGDAEPRSDSPVDIECLVGIVSWVEAGTDLWRPGRREAALPLVRAAWEKLIRTIGRRRIPNSGGARRPPET